MIRVSGLPVDETEKLNQLVKTLEAKRPRNELRSALMDHKRTFENWPLVGEMGDLRAVLGWPAKAVEVLARSGVGELSLFDSDTVALSNLNRQLVALHSTLGQYKA